MGNPGKGASRGSSNDWTRQGAGGPQRPGADMPPRSAVDSPIPGMSPEDFSQLCQSIDETVAEVSRAFGKSVSEMGGAAEKAIEQAKRKYHQAQKERKYQQAQPGQPTGPGWQQQVQQVQQQVRSAVGQAYQPPCAPQPPQGPQSQLAYQQAYPVETPVARRERLAMMRERFRPSWGLTAGGVAMTAVGGVGLLFFGAVCGVGVAIGQAADPAGMVVAGLFAVLTVLAGALLVVGIRRLITSSRFKSFKRIFGTREVCTFAELAERAQLSERKVRAAARKMLKRGLFPQGSIDDGDTCLMVTNGARQQYRSLQQAQRQQLAERQAAEERAAREAAAARAASGQLPDAARAFIEQGKAAVRQMRELDAAIDDAEVSAKIVAIEEVVGRISDRVADEPGVLDGLGRLSDYYLPTTVKLLSAYENLEEQPVQGDNISSSRREIERTLDVLLAAYKKLLDDTFQDVSLDVSSDISVLHAVLAQEGLTENPFNAKP